MRATWLAELIEQFVAHLIVAIGLERRSVRLARHDQSVAVRAECRDHDCGYSDSGLCCHQGGKGLVLDLLESTNWSASRWILVREQPPLARQSLCVLRVAAEHSDAKRVSVRGLPDVLGCPDVLFERRPQLIDGDPEREQRAANLFGRRHACRRAEDQPSQCSCGKAECDAGQRTGWERGAEHDRTQCRERDERPRRQPD